MSRFNQEALDALKLYLVAGRDGSARVAILDGSNHTRKQRFMVYEELKKLGNVEIIFVEVKFMRGVWCNCCVRVAKEGGGCNVMHVR
jgi:hypothetical protein